MSFSWFALITSMHSSRMRTARLLTVSQHALCKGGLPRGVAADIRPCERNDWQTGVKQVSHSDWKTWKNGKAFSSQGKVREFWTDWKSQGKPHKILENWDKYYLIFLVIFKWTAHFLVKWIKFSVKKTKHEKNTGKMAKNTGKVREFCQSGKVGTLKKYYLTATSLRAVKMKYITSSYGHERPHLPGPRLWQHEPHAYNRSCYCTSMPVDFPSAKLAPPPPPPRRWVGQDIPTVTPDRISFSPEFDEQIFQQAYSVWNFTQKLSKTVIHEHFYWMHSTWSTYMWLHNSVQC